MMASPIMVAIDDRAGDGVSLGIVVLMRGHGE
jgi:hypothetical protein